MEDRTNILLIDRPIRRSLFFIISTLIVIIQLMEEQFIAPSISNLVNENLIAMNVIQISFVLFCTYLELVNDSKRLWDMCNNKCIAIIIASVFILIKVLNDVLTYFNIFSFMVGFGIFVLLIFYYLFLLCSPKNILEYIPKEDKSEENSNTLDNIPSETNE